MVAVKVVLVPEGHVMTVAFAIGFSIQELKRHLALELRVPAEVLHISLDGTVCLILTGRLFLFTVNNKSKCESDKSVLIMT